MTIAWRIPHRGGTDKIRGGTVRPATIWLQPGEGRTARTCKGSCHRVHSDTAGRPKDQG
jgi:hypothetical protein